jgi:sugar lactone lactonase YvrE
MRRRSTALLVALLLAGCGGGGGTAPVSAVLKPATASGPTQTGTLSLTFANQPSSSSAARRSPTFVSPAAATAAIAFNGGSATSFDVSAVSPNCTASGGTRTCALTVQAPIGAAESIAVTLLSAAPNAQILGQGSNTLTVVAGTPFTVTVGINPVVAGIAAFGYSFTSGSSFLFGTSSQATVTLTFTDPGGATITGAGNVPNFLVPVTLTSSDPHVTLSPTTLTTPGQTFTMTYDGSTSAVIPVTLNATVGTTSLTSSTLPISAALDGPEGLEFDGSGNLWVANATSNQIVEYPAATLAVGATQTNQLKINGAPLNSPRRMTFDPQNPTDLWIANLDGPSVVGFNTSTNSVFETISTNISQPVDVAIDGRGFIYVANSGGAFANSVSVFAPVTYALVGGSPVSAISSGVCSGSFTLPASLVFNPTDGDGGMITIGTQNTLYAVTADSFELGAPVCVRSETTAVSDPTGLAVSGNKVYTAEEGTTTATIYDLAFSSLLQTISLPNYARGVAVDASGNIYLAITLNNEILEYNASGTLINTIP